MSATGPISKTSTAQLLLACTLLLAALGTGLGCLYGLQASIASMNKLPILPIMLWGTVVSLLLSISACVLLWRGLSPAVKIIAGIALLSAITTVICLLRFFVPAIFLVFASGEPAP